MLALASACATRTVHQDVVDRYGLTIKLRSQRPIFGGDVERGFQHPALISAERLGHILGAVEVDTAEQEGSSIRERSAAIPPALLDDVSVGLSQAFAKAGPDQEIVVMALRKQRQLGAFNRKFLTSFVAYAKGGRLYLLFSRVDWKTRQHRQRDVLPEPWPGEEVMKFRTVTNEFFDRAGRQGVVVDWLDPVFASDVRPAGSASAPGRRKTILAEEPIPAEERPGSLTDEERRELSPEQVRQLDDLERERGEGRITEAEYRRARATLLRGGR